MSGTNTTIQDDNLTLITYSAGWIYNTTDARYASSNHHATTRVGSAVTIKFEGNGIEVTGAMKPEYGTFSVELDGRPSLNASSYSQAQTFRRKLFRLRDLPNGTHAVRVINTGSGFDVDTFTFLTSPTPPAAPASTTSDTNPTSTIIGAILAAVGVFALIILAVLVRRLIRYRREKRGPFGGDSSETLVQAHPYDYVPPENAANRRSKYNNQGLSDVPAAAFTGSPVSANPPSINRIAPATSGPSHPSLPYLAADMGRDRSETVTSQSSTSSIYSENLTQQPPVRHSTLSAYFPEPPLRPVSVRSASVGSGSIRPGVRPFSIAGRPGSIRPTIPESPFDSKRLLSHYATQPTIREYNKRDTIFGKRSIDDRGRIDLLADDVPETAHPTEFSSPRQTPRPLMNRSTSFASTVYVPPPQPLPDYNGPPRLILNTTMLSSITDPIEWSPSISTMRFATRPNSGVTQAASTTPSRSNSRGESLFSPSEEEGRWNTRSKSQRRRSSLVPPIPPLPPLPEPEPEPNPYVPLAPPPASVRHKRNASSFGSTNSTSDLAVGTPKGTILNNSSTVKGKPFVMVGLPSTPRPVQVVSSRSSPLTLSQSALLAPFAQGTNGTPRSSSGMRMVDLEAGVVGVVEEKRRWARVRSMMGVVGDVNKDEALFEIVAGSPPPLPSPGRMQAPRMALPGSVGGPRVLKKPAPLALSGLSNFESSVYDSSSSNANGGVRKRFVRDVIVTAKASASPEKDSNTNTRAGWKKMSILQSAVINGRANKEEVELVTGMKMDI